ncbi:MAG: RHS repeat-associated core domain-containing protein, partial [Clostridia bacterium]|nr:RHS repeat-associated core domain-containing protein [Clostridia bacterium]
NLQGDIIGIIDNQSNTVSGYQYDSWGKLLKITGNQELGKLNPFRYRGYYYDNETELYYLNSRYYDPEVGRFVSADDLAVLDGANDHIIENNLFAYCLNNPVNMSDDDGNWPKWATNLVKVGIGAAAIGIGVAATVATGGAAAPALIASLKIATTSAIVGAVSEAGTSAVKHRISTGSWKGVGKKILRGAVNGAADGFMWGGISAGATFTTVAAKGIKVQQIGKLKPKGKSGNGYFGVQYRNKRNSLKSIELHSPHKSGPHQHWHWQRNTWNPNNGRITGKAKHWTWYGKRMK